MNARSFYFAATLVLVAGLTGCSRPAPAEQQAQVKQAFEGFKDQIALNRAGPALDFLDRATLDYLRAAATRPPYSGEPTPDLLIRRVSEKFARGPIGSDLNLADLAQRVLGQGLLRPGDLDPLNLGPVTMNADGQTAQAEVLWRGNSSTLQLTFRLEDDRWKINLLNLLPYAASALAMDRAIKHETEDAQIARLVSAIPIW